MLPQYPGSSKAKSYHGWGTSYDSFWCCYGTGVETVTCLILSWLLIQFTVFNHFLLVRVETYLCFCANNLILSFVVVPTGIESFSKLGDSIYFEEGEAPGLYIIQYISSSLDWKSGQIVLNQKVDPIVSSDPYLRVTLTFSPKKVFTESIYHMSIRKLVLLLKEALANKKKFNLDPPWLGKGC
jgi:hypothetical protein